MPRYDRSDLLIRAVNTAGCRRQHLRGGSFADGRRKSSFFYGSSRRLSWIHKSFPVLLSHCFVQPAGRISPLFFTGVAAIESLLSSWTSAQTTNGDGGSSSSGDDDDSEYMDSDSDSECESGSGSGSGSEEESGSGGSSSSDASDIDRAELDALLDESRDVLGDGALGGGGGPRKRLRR